MVPWNVPKMSCVFDATGYATRFQLVPQLHGEAPLGSRESTRPTSDGMNLRDFKEPSGHI